MNRLRERSNYKIDNILKPTIWYVFRKHTNMYLCTDGRIRDWYPASEKLGIDVINRITSFSSKRKASSALKKYLER